MSTSTPTVSKPLSLSLDQQAAIEAPAQGSLKIVAGAGSGKTEVLTRRITRLLNSGIAPDELVALTYTNKAAGAMKERLLTKAQLPPAALRELTVSTFHSFLSGLIKSDPFACGLDRGTAILTAGNRELLLKTILDRFAELHASALFEGPESLGGKMLKPLLAAFPQALGNIRRYLLSPGEYLRLTEAGLQRGTPAGDTALPVQMSFPRRAALWLFRFYHFYLQTLGEKHLLDFDDILLRGRDLLTARLENGDQTRERVFLIDEFQDNNREQLGIIELFLNGGRGHLTVVGDPRQSIYRFQGADVATFNTFQADREITLCENYRSYREILLLADEFILAGNEPAIRAAGHQTPMAGPSPRPFPIAVLLSSSQGNRSAPEAHDQPTEETSPESLDIPDLPPAAPSTDPQTAEAEAIASMIDGLVRGEVRRSMIPKGSTESPKLTWGDIAIVVASIRRLPRALEDALLARNIPYLLSGLGFYDRAEIKGIMAFLSLLANPQDDRSLLTILSGPLYGIDDAQLAPLAVAGRKSGISLFNHLLSMSPAALPEAARSFQRLFMKLQERHARLRLLDLVYELLDEGGFREFIARQSHPLKKRRMENNLGKFVDIVRQFEAGGIFTTLRDFLAWYQQFEASGVEESEAGLGLEEGEAIRIMTVHKAKGLEFPVVFMPFLRARPYRRRDQLIFSRDHGLLVRKNEFGENAPDQRLQDHDSLEIHASEAEERRKWYVGLTRAQELLIISGRGEHAGKPGEPLHDLCRIVTEHPDIGRVRPLDEAMSVVTEWNAFPATDSATQAAIPSPASSSPPSPLEPPLAEGDKPVDDGLETQIHALTGFHQPVRKGSDKPASHEDVFSLTDLTIFEACPRRYYYTRLHLPAFTEPELALEADHEESHDPGAIHGTTPSETSPSIVSSSHAVSGSPSISPSSPVLPPHPVRAAEIGNLIHQVLRRFHATPVSSLSPDERRQRLKGFLSRFAPWYIGEAQEAFSRAAAILDGYAVSPLSERDSWLQEAEVNLRFEAGGSTFWIRGFADRVDRDESGIILVDYKTRPFNSAAHRKYGRQMALYLTAAHRGIIGVPGTLNFPRLEIAYMTPEGTRVVPAQPDLLAFEQWAMNIVSAIRSERAWLIPPAVECQHCPFVILCSTSSPARKADSGIS